MMVKDPCQPLAEPSLDFVHQVVLVEVGGLLLLWMKLFMLYVMTLSREVVRDGILVMIVGVVGIVEVYNPKVVDSSWPVGGVEFDEHCARLPRLYG